MMGLTLAHHLAKKHHVTVYEQADQVGGLSTWHDYGPFTWDKYYHVILRSDTSLLNLISELKLEDKLFWKQTKTGFLWNGSHHSFSTPWEFLQFPPLNLWQKGRLGTGIIYNALIRNSEKIAHLTAKEWLTRISGKSVYTQFWEPLLISKFGALKDQVPAPILWSTLKRYFTTREKGQEMVGTLSDCGMKVLFDALIKGIDHVHTNTNIDNLSVLPNNKISICENTYDAVISTLPRSILKKIYPAYETSYPHPTYLGVIRVALLLKKPFSDCYITNLIDRCHPFTGIIDVTNLVPSSTLKQHSLVMFPRYDIPTSPWFEKSDAEISSLFLESIHTLIPDLSDQLVACFVHREKRVQALWIDTPPPAIEPFRVSQAPIWSLNNEMIGQETLNNNSVINLATQGAKWIDSQLTSQLT
ncbi:MAG: FAD-dependent oxidoreductase [Chlamydiia bacterium]|nr:FAD-dependent oxidoreductase [Chlamydiia bacterium]